MEERTDVELVTLARPVKRHIKHLCCHMGSQEFSIYEARTEGNHNIVVNAPRVHGLVADEILAVRKYLCRVWTILSSRPRTRRNAT